MVERVGRVSNVKQEFVIPAGAAVSAKNAMVANNCPTATRSLGFSSFGRVVGDRSAVLQLTRAMAKCYKSPDGLWRAA